MKDVSVCPCFKKKKFLLVILKYINKTQKDGTKDVAKEMSMLGEILMDYLIICAQNIILFYVIEINKQL